MPSRRRTAIPSIPNDASKELVAIQDGLAGDTADLRAEAIGTTTDTKTANYSAKLNEVIRCKAPAAGMALVFPASGPSTQNKWIDVILLGGNAVKVQPTAGTIDNAASVSLTAIGRYLFKSDGLNGWWRVTGVSSSGAIPTGTGFRHVTAGVEDAAAKLVDTADVNNNQITYAKLQQGAANTIPANATAGAANFADLAVGANTVVGRVAGNIVAAALVNAQITANTITAASQAQMAANTVKANATAGAANEADLVVAVDSIVGRSGGNLAALAAAVQSCFIKAAGNFFNATCAADQCLQRVGSADLGFSATARLLRAPQILTSASVSPMTHPTGTRLIKVRGCGSGAAGGGAAATAGAFGSCGGSATYAEKTFTAVGTSSTFSVPAAATGVSAAAGNNGASATFTHNGVTLTAPGGTGGTTTAGASTVALTQGGVGGAAATNADVSVPGQQGAAGWRSAVATQPIVHLGNGGDTPLGIGGPGRSTIGTVAAGAAGTGFGSGGSGVLNGTTATAAPGGNSGPGVWIVEEFS